MFCQADVADSVEHLSCHILWGSSTLNPGLACLYASTWIEMAQPSSWPPRGQQVSHQRCIWGIFWMQMMKHTSKGIHPAFETQGRCHQNRDIRGHTKRTDVLHIFIWNKYWEILPGNVGKDITFAPHFRDIPDKPLYSAVKFIVVFLINHTTNCSQ